MPPDIVVDRVTKRYGPVPAVNGCSFTVDKGCIFGLVGADGAGKSTLMRMLTTLLPCDTGDGRVLGRSIYTDSAYIRAHIGYMPQQFSLYGDLSVIENINFFADVFGVTGAARKEHIRSLLAFSHLASFRNRAAAKLSGGMKQKLALCCALIHRPALLILDEPTTGVDPVSRKEFWDILKQLRDDGKTILLSTPYMDEASWCDMLLFLHEGSVLCSGTPQRLLNEFPLPVFHATFNTNEPLLHCPADLQVSMQGAHIYPCGGVLHIVPSDRSVDQDKLLSQVRTLIPGQVAIVPSKPVMEDVFFHHIVTYRTTREKTGKPV